MKFAQLEIDRNGHKILQDPNGCDVGEMGMSFKIPKM